MACGLAGLPSIESEPMTPPDQLAIDSDGERRRQVDGEFEYTIRHGEALNDPLQPSLFPEEDLIIPESLRTMRKAVAAIHAIPLKGADKQSLNTKRLFDALILAAQIDVRGRGPQMMDRIRLDRVSPMFEIHVTDLARLAGIPGKNYERIYEHLDELHAMRMSWNLVGEDSTVEWEMKAHFLATYGRGVNAKRGLVRYSIDPSILGIVLEPSNWATLSLQVMSGLPTPTSYALYQNVWRYVNTAQKVTAALPVETWIELLLGPCRFVKVDGSGRKYVENYGEFKARYLLDAIARVNNVPALHHSIELKELKSGRRISKLQFRFVPKQQQKLELPVTWPVDILEPLRKLGFTADEIAGMSEAFPVEVIKDSLDRLVDARKRLATTGKKITSPKAYFGGILDKVARGAAEEQIDVEKLEAEVRQEEAQREAEERRTRLEERFTTHQRDRFREAFFELPDERRKEAQRRYEESTDFAKAKVLVEAKGWTKSNSGALAMLRPWLEKSVPDLYRELLPHPHDRDLQAWLLWQTEQALLKGPG